jgi:hypothetical protein
MHRPCALLPNKTTQTLANQPWFNTFLLSWTSVDTLQFVQCLMPGPDLASRISKNLQHWPDESACSQLQVSVLAVHTCFLDRLLNPLGIFLRSGRHLHSQTCRNCVSQRWGEKKCNLTGWTVARGKQLPYQHCHPSGTSQRYHTPRFQG